MAKFDDLAAALKLTKGKLEESQYLVEQRRSELIATQRAAKVCEGHEASIASLTTQLFTANEQIKKLNSDKEKLDKKLQQISSFFGKE